MHPPERRAHLKPDVKPGFIPPVHFCMRDVPTSTPICSRCGYDLSGIPPTWTESCPLQGTCSECGLGFAWADIHDPEHFAPKWSFEHATTRRVQRFLATTLVAFRPARLWRSMTMDAPFMFNRLGLYAALLLVLAYLVTAAASWGIMRTYTGPAPMLAIELEMIVNALIWPIPSQGTARFMVAPMTGATVALLLWCLLIPIPFLVLARSFAAAKCRRAHLFRAWALFLPIACAIPCVSALFWTLQILAWSWSSWISNALYFVAIWSYLLVIPLFAWIVRWWLLFVRHYLRLDHPKAVASLMILTSFLLAVAIVIWVPGNGLMSDLAYLLMRMGIW